MMLPIAMAFDYAVFFDIFFMSYIADARVYRMPPAILRLFHMLLMIAPDAYFLRRYARLCCSALSRRQHTLRCSCRDAR